MIEYLPVKPLFAFRSHGQDLCHFNTGHIVSENHLYTSCSNISHAHVTCVFLTMWLKT